MDEEDPAIRSFLEDMPRSLRGLRFASVVGRGAFGVVFSAFDPERAGRVAVKIVSRQLLEQAFFLTAFEQELRIHESLCHPNIVRIFSIVYGPKFIYMVMELCSGGDLLDYIQNTEFRPAVRVLAIFTQVLSAVEYLHERGIAHLDIKPENILLGDGGQVKLADFGCCEAPPKFPRRNAVGTLFYAAPELYMSSRPDNRAADVWSLGILFFTLECGVLPFLPGDDDAIHAQILSGNLLIAVQMPGYVADTVRACCQLDPDQRPTVKELLERDIFKQERERTSALSPLGPPLTRAVGTSKSFTNVHGPSVAARQPLTLTRRWPASGVVGASKSVANVLMGSQKASLAQRSHPRLGEIRDSKSLAPKRWMLASRLVPGAS
jgi:serine/threonine protein kinase